jgi:small GTP-binding protein
MEALKIVITGAYAAGKTQFIRSVSEIEVVGTEAEVSQSAELELKDQTTVALDFGMITVNEDYVLHLYGTPGQERFDFMWDILSLGCIGYIVMVDSTRPAHLKEAVHIIEHFSKILSVPFLVAANKQDDPVCLPLEYIRQRLHLDPEVPLVGCVAKERESVKQVLLTLVGMLGP